MTLVAQGQSDLLKIRQKLHIGIGYCLKTENSMGLPCFGIWPISMFRITSQSTSFLL